MEEAPGESRPSFDKLLTKELRLDRRQWEEAPKRNREAQASTPPDALLEVDCLVHDDWVRSISSGSLPSLQKPPLPAEEIHWLLQTSCDCPTPNQWQRVSILCIRKTLEPDSSNKRSKKFLISQDSGYSKESIHELLTQISQENILVSWRELLQSVHPVPSTGPHTPTSAYVREVVHKLYHTEMCSLQSGRAGGQKKKVTGRDVGKLERRIQAKNASQLSAEEQVHSNLSPLLAAVESHKAFYLVFPYMRFTLFDIAVHSPAMFNDSVSKPLFVLYQLLKAMEHCHKVGVTLGPLSMQSVFVDSRLWVQIRMPAAILRLEHDTSDTGKVKKERGRGGENSRSSGEPKRGKEREKMWLRRERGSLSPTREGSKSASASTLACSEVDSEEEWTDSAKDTSTESSPVKQLHMALDTSDHRLSHSIPQPPLIPLNEAVKKWQHGELDNFTYLMLLNHYAGRRVGDPNNHPIFPWVTDFTHPTRNFRDFTKSKHRLNKGDDQLNFTYYSAMEDSRRVVDQDTPIPHHVGDISTDVTYYVYMARRTPRDVLCSHVRPRWVPEEYPVSIEKMYIWTPDESIPEFFTDPLIFNSIHSDLPDLELPLWCPTPEVFIMTHRRLLEGDYVSSQLHHWIDLTFGYKLTGEAAIRAKNVYVTLVDKHKNPKNHGIVQLFRSSHPKRVSCSSAPIALLEWESYLGQSSVSDGASFPINQEELVKTPLREQNGNVERPPVRTLKSIVEQQRQSLGEGGGEGRGGAEGTARANEEALQDGDSSFEEVTVPDELYSGAPSTHQNNMIGITYGESPLDLPPPSQGKSYVKQKESAVLNNQPLTGQQNRFRVVNYFRTRKHNQSEGSSDDYLWQNAEISLPKDLLRGLIEHEERAHFVARCCKDFGDMLGPSWEQQDLEKASHASTCTSLPLMETLHRQHTDPLFSPSLEECVTVDVASAVVTVIEMCCMRELRVATCTDSSLLERISVIRKLLCSGQLRLPSYLQNLAEFVLLSDIKKTLSGHLPHLSPSLLLQSFIPVVSFPSYFERVYSFAFNLELLCREAGLRKYHESQQLASKPRSLPSSHCADFDPSVFDKIMALVVENLQSLLRATQGEGFILLLLHLYPLFQYPETGFEMMQLHLDTLGKFMSHPQMDRLFTSILLHFFDRPLEPHQQGYLLSRSMADFLIRHFGLHVFLVKYLEFFLEAVLEPARLMTKGTGVRKNVFRLKESESVLTLIPTDLGQSLQYDENKRQAQLTFSVDLSEVGGYSSDREYSSGESDSDYQPDTSLLARSGMVLGSVGMSPDLQEEGEKRGDKGHVKEGDEQSGQQRKLSQSSIAENLESAQAEKSQVRGNETLPLSSSLPGETEADKEYNGSQNTIRIDTTSSVFRTSLDSPCDSEATTNLGSPTIEDSLRSSISSSSFSKHSSFRGRLKSGSMGGSVSQDGGFSVSVEGQLEEEGTVGRGEERRGSMGGEGEEEQLPNKARTEARNDPEMMAINGQIAEVAGDCLCWLQRRLGPLLATRHIISPLLNGMHRCFTGILDRGDRETVVLKCLSSMAELYGDNVLLKLYLPQVEGWVSSAMSRMTVKTESNLAAALAVVKIVIQQLSDLLLDQVTGVLCENIFIPLIQLLSSQTIFPSGGEARATVCHSLVLILLKIGEKLGRERSSVLLETLRLFFTCFDGVYTQCGSHDTLESVATVVGERSRAESSSVLQHSTLVSQKFAPGKLQAGGRERSNTASPSMMSSRRGKWNHSKNTVSLERESQATSSLATQVTSDNGVTPIINKPKWPEALEKQLQATFTPAMAHATYIPFCKLIGQIKITNELQNSDLIEQIAYKYDNDVKEKICLPSVFPTSEDEPSSLSSAESDDSTAEEYDTAHDVTIKLGPVVALQRKRGLSEDAVDFGRSNWFVNLQHESSVDSTGNVVTPTGVMSGVERGNEGLIGVSGGVVGVGVGGSTEVMKGMGEEGVGGKGWMEGVLQLIQTRPVADTQQGSSGAGTDSLARHSFNFDMKFQPSYVTQTGQTLVDGKSTQPISSSDNVDCSLNGQWRELWESQLGQSPHNQPPYSHCMGKKLQTYTGHKGAVRCLAASDTEHFFVSGSKDKTVKLWLLRNQGDGSAHLSSHLTYSHHQKSVSHVELISALGNVLSCDGTLQLWDTESGYPIHHFSSPRTREFIAMKCLLPPQPVAVVATNDLSLRFVDFRARTLQHTWKLQFSTGGIIRCLACGDNWVAVGTNNGTVNTLDLRMGELLHQWRPSDYSIVQTTTWNENLFQLHATHRGNLVTSVGPGTIQLWRPSTGKLLAHIRGQSSSTHCLDTMEEQLISVSSNGHVVIHNCFERTKDPSSSLYWGTKVRSRELKGGVTSMATLQEKRLLLLGSDNGQVVLMA